VDRLNGTGWGGQDAHARRCLGRLPSGIAPGRWHRICASALPGCRSAAGLSTEREAEISMMSVAGSNPSPRPCLRAGTAVTLVALASLVAHLLTAGRYGFHRDELYYIACGMHPAWGYVDHPALTPLLARLATALFGGSLIGLRLCAALAAAAVIALTGGDGRR
jgi:hypothetical protein